MVSKIVQKTPNVLEIEIMLALEIMLDIYKQYVLYITVRFVAKVFLNRIGQIPTVLESMKATQ